MKTISIPDGATNRDVVKSCTNCARRWNVHVKGKCYCEAYDDMITDSEVSVKAKDCDYYSDLH